MQIQEAVVTMVGIAASVALPLLLVAIVLFFRHKRHRLHHETLVRLAEKGVPVPLELLAPPAAPPSPKAGLVLVALGAALGLFFWQMGKPWSIGLIPGLMGVAYLVAWRHDARRRPGPDASP